jgi:hypothetical protein
MPASPSPRRKVIAELEAHIARAEAARAGYLRDLEALPGARRAKVMLAQVEERLAQLRRSREVLLAGEEGHHARS